VTLTPVGGAIGSGGLSLAARDAQTTVTRLVGFSVAAAPAAPDAPTSLTASTPTGKLNLAWTPATTGSAATSYAVYVGTAPGSTTLPVQTTAATSITVAISTTGTYYARVRAQNDYGQSADSPEAVATVTASKGKPGPPKPRVSSSGRTVSIAWDPPVSGDPVTSYTLEVGSAPGLANLVVVPLGPTTTFAAAGVPDGTYWLRVRGASDAGQGDPSEDVGLVMSAAGGCVGLPLAPALQTPEASGAAVTLSWTAPAGSAPTGYVLYAGSAPGRSNLAPFDTGSTPTRLFFALRRPPPPPPPPPRPCL
jgi:predicted phage tail protein